MIYLFLLFYYIFHFFAAVLCSCVFVLCTRAKTNVEKVSIPSGTETLKKNMKSPKQSWCRLLKAWKHKSTGNRVMWVEETCRNQNYNVLAGNRLATSTITSEMLLQLHTSLSILSYFRSCCLTSYHAKTWANRPSPHLMFASLTLNGII